MTPYMSELTESQQKLAEEFAKLLAQAPLQDGLKEVFMQNLDRLTEVDLAQLIRWLSDRNQAVGELEASLVELQKKHEAEWKSLAREQGQVAMDIVDEEIEAAMKGQDTEGLIEAAVNDGGEKKE
jgi:hypothetical protein